LDQFNKALELDRNLAESAVQSRTLLSYMMLPRRPLKNGANILRRIRLQSGLDEARANLKLLAAASQPARLFERRSAEEFLQAQRTKMMKKPGASRAQAEMIAGTNIGQQLLHAI